MHFTGTKSSPLDSDVVEVQKMFSSHGGHLTYAMYHHGKTSNQIITMMKQRKGLMKSLDT